MKALFVSTLALLVVLAHLPASFGCTEGIIPNYIYQNIANNEDFEDEFRTWANQSFWHMKELHHQRHIDADQNAGQGLTEEGGDDQDYDDEQEPGEASVLNAEMTQLDEADEEQPQPALVPPDAPPTSGTTIEHRRSLPPQSRALDARQSTNFNRFVYTDYRTCNKAPPYALARTEGGSPASDSEVNLVYDSLAIVLRFYRNIFNRNLIDGAGGRVHGTARYCQSLGNAFWDGRQMLFGEGDGRVFNFGSFTRSLSVAGHEVTHGVIQYSNALRYQSQSGALNEHLADVFGILVEQFHFGESSQTSKWLIGPNIPVGGGAIRSMKAPGTAYNTPALGRDPQPANMRNYYAGSDDNFGVHINSGIPNHAFYLFATAIQGFAYQEPGHIWYDVMVGNSGRFNYAGETFNSFAQRTIQSANRLYNDPTITSKLRQAWQQVGVL